MTVSNSCGTKTLKFNDGVGVLLNEEMRMKSSGAAETSGSALSVKRRGRSMNREKKKNSKSKFKFVRSKLKSRNVGFWQCDENGHLQRDYKQTKEMAKAKRKIQYMSRAVMNLMT